MVFADLIVVNEFLLRYFALNGESVKIVVFV